jgi:hypothetical protein
MAQKLSEQRIEEIFAAYCERQSANYMSEKCRVHFKTAKKYIQTHNFAARLAKVREKAELKIDDSIAARKARELKIIDGALTSYVKALQGKATAVCECGRTITIPVPGLKAKLSDIESLIRTRCLVTGEATERTAGQEVVPKLIKYCLPVPLEIRNIGALPRPEQKPAEYPPPVKPQNRAQNEV